MSITAATLTTIDWRTSEPAKKALKALEEHFLLISNHLTKTTKINLEMGTSPDPKKNDLILTISNPAQNILTPMKNWPRVTGLLTANEKGMSISICPLGKEDSIMLLSEKIGHNWHPPVVINLSKKEEVKIFSLCQNGKTWYKETNIGYLGHNPIIQKISEDILNTLKNAGI